MFRLCKKVKSFRIFLLYCCLSGILLWKSEIPCQADAGDRTEEQTAALCDENEYILLSSGKNYAEIYDSKGNYLDRCRVYLNDLYGIATIKKNFLLDYVDGDIISIYSMADLQTVLEFPYSEYYVQISGDVCLATNRNTGQICLYDCHGELLYSSGETAWAENEYQGILMVLEHGYLVGSCRVTDEDIFPVYGPIWISSSGQENREITDPYLTEAFVKREIQEFGDYMLVYNWENETGVLYDLDGKVLLERIEAYLCPYTEDNWFYSYNYNTKIALVLQKADEMYTVYDTQLQECAMFPALETEPRNLGYAAGYIEGMSYHQLEGNICAGFVRYKNKAWCPYAETKEGVLVYADGHQIPLTVESGQNLIAFNERYAMTEYNEEESYITCLIDRKTGNVLMDSCWDEDGSISFEIGEECCIIVNTKWNGDDCRTSLTIRDEENQICYSSDKASAGTWKNGYIVLKRGIYHGIADTNGNWIVRTIYEDE